MIKNPFVEYTSTSKEIVTIRLSGKVVFTNDIIIKQKVVKKYPHLKASYKDADDPSFEVFYIENGDIIMSDFSGNPEIKVSF